MAETNKIKEKYFGYYYKQKVMWNGTELFHVNTSWNWTHPSHVLLLTSLKDISIEDSIEVAKMQVHRYEDGRRTTMYDHHAIFMGEKSEDYVKSLLINTVYWDEFSLQVWDYLRSKGYALPYFNYSVDDLVKLNIIKLKS